MWFELWKWFAGKICCMKWVFRSLFRTFLPKNPYISSAIHAFSTNFNSKFEWSVSSNNILSFFLSTERKQSLLWFCFYRSNFLPKILDADRVNNGFFIDWIEHWNHNKSRLNICICQVGKSYQMGWSNLLGGKKATKSFAIPTHFSFLLVHAICILFYRISNYRPLLLFVFILIYTAILKKIIFRIRHCEYNEHWTFSKKIKFQLLQCNAIKHQYSTLVYNGKS